ncbi:MAG: ThuA domain-containing protein [Pirellulales bacterium]
MKRESIGVTVCRGRTCGQPIRIDVRGCCVLAVGMILFSSSSDAQHPWQRPIAREITHVQRIVGEVEQHEPSRDLRVVWVWDFDKGHASGFHEHVKVRDLFSLLLSRVPRVTVDLAHQFPTADQWKQADLVVFYLQMQPMTAEQFRMMDAYLERGGGMVAIHSAFIQGPVGSQVAERFGLAWNGKRTRWGVLPLTSKVVQPRSHGVFDGFPNQLALVDEHYWNLGGKLEQLTVLATSQAGPERASKGPPRPEQLDGKPWPLFWSREIGKGRVFGSIPGHNFFTFNDPYYRIILLRAMAWTMRESFDPFKSLVTAKVKTSPADEDWPMYNRTANGWRFNEVESTLSRTNVASMKLKWRFPSKHADWKMGMVSATPSIVDGYVYFGTGTFPKFYRLKPNGELDWVYEIGDKEERNRNRNMESRGLIPRGGVYSSALVTDTSVFFTSTKGVAYCLDRETGIERWKIDSKADGFPGAHRANMMMASPILADGKVIFGGGAYEHPQPRNPEYACCQGRGFVIAVEPKSGMVVWKYDVGPKPIRFDPPITMKSPWGTRTFKYGPSTSSVWSTPSWDEQSNTVFFGTDIHNSPRKPTEDDPRNYTRHSAAVIAVDAATGKEKWVTQLNKHDVWNHSLPAYDPETGYKDQAVGDTPKIVNVSIDGKQTQVVGAGCKNGGFYIMRLADGSIIAHTPIYTGPPKESPDIDPRTLALPSPIGGLQTGCASDGLSFFTNGIDTIFKGTAGRQRTSPPTAGRVTAISSDTERENWRHERPKVPWVGGTKDKPLFRNTGDPVASGIAVANGVVYFTTFSSNKLVAIDATTGKSLREIYLGPILCGPSVSRGRVYVGTGNTHFEDGPAEAYFPKRDTGVLYCFGLPGDDAIDRVGDGNR